MQEILEQNLTLERLTGRKDVPLKTEVSILGRIFGCRHRNLSRPFNDIDKKSCYRVCLECGARREFDIRSFKTLGNFYFLPHSVHVLP